MFVDPTYAWVVSPFDLEYTDDDEGEWTLALGALFYTP